MSRSNSGCNAWNEGYRPLCRAFFMSHYEGEVHKFVDEYIVIARYVGLFSCLPAEMYGVDATEEFKQVIARYVGLFSCLNSANETGVFLSKWNIMDCYRPLCRAFFMSLLVDVKSNYPVTDYRPLCRAFFMSLEDMAVIWVERDYECYRPLCRAFFMSLLYLEAYFIIILT